MAPPPLPDLPPAFRAVPHEAWQGGRHAPGERAVAEEVAVAFSYNRLSYAVMMASPTDLEDFAIGFSLAERIVATPGEIEELDIVAAEAGIELRMWLPDDRMDGVTERRRALAGPTGCGLCGLESLAETMRAPLPVAGGGVLCPAAALSAAIAGMADAQALNRRTHAVHAAGFWHPDRGLLAVREDVGRHNALDKLAGALSRQAMAAAQGAVLLTSRVSVELVQKAAAMGAPVLAAVSAPTALALRVAEAAGITVVGIARGDGFEVFTHPDRIGTG
jgi:FdhD protein